uniref:Uncharacterized protein n=1 Tax=Avena sativa TaxID=4498 RepID=A0ACD5VNA9_AVESA
MGKKKGGVSTEFAAAIAAAKKKGGSAAAGTSTAGAGKKKGAGTRVTNGAWRVSIIKSSELRLLRQDGVLSPVVGDSRVPGGEVTACPPAGFRVMFLAFIIRGLSLPLHPFFTGLLCFYGLQLHQLSPNSILHIACYITLCECWLRVEPHFGLFKRIFKLKRQSAYGSVVYDVGGCGIHVDSSITYFDIKLMASVQGWRDKWFYIRDQKADGEHFGLAPFDPAMSCRRRRSWKNVVMPSESEETEVLYERVCDLESRMGKVEGGCTLIRRWLRRCIQPLQARIHPMFQWAGADDVTRISADGISVSEVHKRVRLLTKYTTKDVLPSELVVPPFDASNPPPKDWKVSPNFPPLPEGVIPHEVDEEDESESTVPFEEEEEAPESSSPDTRKCACIEDSDVSFPSTPEGPTIGAESPIPGIPVSSMAPSARKKMRLPRESSESEGQTFDFDKFDCQPTSSSSGDVQFLKESGVADSKAKEVAERTPSPPLAAHSGHNSSSSPHAVEHQMVVRTTARQSTSESLEEHLIVKEAARLAEQVLAMGRQHALLDNRHRVVETEHNVLLRKAASLEKTLTTAMKSRDEAVAVLDESRKHEEDLCASIAAREKLFEEQLFSIAKSLSDAGGLSFDAQALRRDDALEGAVAAVEDHSASIQGTLTKAKGILSRIREELAPKAELIENLDDLVESLAGGIPSDFRKSHRAVGATMALAMVQAHGVEMDPAAVSKAMPVGADGQQVVFAPFATVCGKYGPQLINIVAKYSEELQRANKAAKATALGAGRKSVASYTATDSMKPPKPKSKSKKQAAPQ